MSIEGKRGLDQWSIAKERIGKWNEF